jgi:hypothetical protein
MSGTAWETNRLLTGRRQHLTHRGIIGRPSSAGVVTAGLIAGVVVEVVLLVSGERAMTAALMATATLVGLLVLRAAARPTPPVVLVPVVLLGGIGLAGYLFYPAISSQARVSAVIPDNPELYEAAAFAFLVAEVAFAAGAAVVLALAPHGGERAALADAAGIKIRPGLLLAAGWLPLVVLVYGKGRALMYSTTYLAAAGPRWAVSAGTSLALVAILSLTMAFYRTGGATRLVAFAGLAGWTVTLFAISTRTLAVVPALIIMARLLSRPRERILGRLVIAVLASIVLLNLALTLRIGIAGFGLRPFTARLLADPSLMWQFDPGGIFGNVLFSVPLAGQVAVYEPDLSGRDFVTSINPLPGGLTDWPLLSQQLRLNIFTPYSGLGELSNHGPLILAFYLAAAGALFALLDVTTRRLAGAIRVAGSLLLLGLATLFTFDLLQYNLRSGTRILYYAIALMVMLRVGQVVSGPADGSRLRHDNQPRTAPATRR